MNSQAGKEHFHLGLKGQASIESCSGTTAVRLPSRGQASIEFLAFMAVDIALLAIALMIYSAYSESAARTGQALEAQGMCQEVSSFFGSFAALGEGASASFTFKKPYTGTDYSVRMIGDTSIVRVDYNVSGNLMGVGCRFPAANVEDEEGEERFPLNRSFTLQNSNGVVVVVQ